jgi:hypothetical protein
MDGFPADACSGRIPMAEHRVTSRYSVVTNTVTTSCRTLTPELCRLRVSKVTHNHPNDCSPTYFQLKPRLAIRHERFVSQRFLGIKHHTGLYLSLLGCNTRLTNAYFSTPYSLKRGSTSLISISSVISFGKPPQSNMK